MLVRKHKHSSKHHHHQPDNDKLSTKKSATQKKHHDSDRMNQSSDSDDTTVNNRAEEGKSERGVLDVVKRRAGAPVINNRMEVNKHHPLVDPEYSGHGRQEGKKGRELIKRDNSSSSSENDDDVNPAPLSGKNVSQHPSSTAGVDRYEKSSDAWKKNEPMPLADAIATHVIFSRKVITDAADVRKSDDKRRVTHDIRRNNKSHDVSGSSSDEREVSRREINRKVIDKAKLKRRDEKSMSRRSSSRSHSERGHHPAGKSQRKPSTRESKSPARRGRDIASKNCSSPEKDKDRNVSSIKGKRDNRAEKSRSTSPRKGKRESRNFVSRSPFRRRRTSRSGSLSPSRDNRRDATLHQGSARNNKRRRSRSHKERKNESDERKSSVNKR